MKLITENKRSTFMSLFLATALLASSGLVASKAYSQDDILEQAEDALADGDSLEMDQIDIDGKLSASELMRRKREKLEERNKVMVEKKIEDIRVKQEIALTNKLQDAFGKGLNNLNDKKVEDKVVVVQAAPVAPQPAIIERIIEVPAPIIKVEKKSKIIPMLGTANTKSDRIDLDSNVTFGLTAETLVTSQLSMGIGFGYATTDLTDVANTYVDQGYGNVYNNTTYTGVYGSNGRAMNLKKISIEGNAKYFFIEEAMIKPFVGVAVNLNRSALKYENQSTVIYNNSNFGNEDYSTSALAGAVKIGAEASFTDTVGLNIDFSYTKNITSGISKSSEVSASTNPDQGRLENIQREIEDGAVTAIQAGLVIKF